MSNLNHDGAIFIQGLNKLGFYETDDCLFLTKTSPTELPSPQVHFYLEKANDFDATAVYLRKQLNGGYKSQVYLYDFTDRDFNEQNQNELTEIQKKIWSRGEVPLACIFYTTEIKILNCTTHIQEDNYLPVHLVTDLKYVGEAHHLYNEQFALKIKSGVFWDEEENKNEFSFKNSAYDNLIKNIRFIIAHLKKEYKKKITEDLITKIIVQAILIKYLEERIDSDGNKLLTNKYFKKYNGSDSFTDVLRTGKFVELLDDLNDPKTGFNGNVFQWSKQEQLELKRIRFSALAELLDTKKTSLESSQLEMDFPGWRYFEFRYIPVELISRLYEEFLGANKKIKGIYYTPAHLAQLLIDESIPLKKYNEIDPYTFQILDPACGSGIFLVTAFKRLVQIWRLRNNMDDPELEELKEILNNVYGVDQEEQAINLASFSLCLALCNELKPLVIINKLKFDDLRENNLVKSDFFIEHKLQNHKFDLVIGNPPFVRGGISEYKDNFLRVKDKFVSIPGGQVALKFLSNTFRYLKPNGLQCLIIKSTSLLYGSGSVAFRKFLFSNLNVVQILDFTALARNKSLWDNGADVAASAIFIKNSSIEQSQNILHLTFRRTKATRERIIFEVDDYDLHFINRETATENEFIWKINLLGGGRIKKAVEGLNSLETFEEFLERNDCAAGEGYIKASDGDLRPNYIFEIPTLPTDAIRESGVDYSQLKPMNKNLRFVKVPNEIIFRAPNVIIWENIGKDKLPVFYNEKSFSFKDKIIGIASKKKNKEVLKSIAHSFNLFSSYYRFFIFVTSSQILINRNTAILKKDIMRLRYIESLRTNSLSSFDHKIINDTNIYLQEFLRLGERAKAVRPINPKDFQTFIKKYGEEFSSILNLIYENQKKKFRLSDIVTLRNSFIATIFKYDINSKEPHFHSDNTKLNLKELTDVEISKHLTVNRIVKMYPQKDTIVFIKPNQYRYWLSLIAYRDADKCFSDLSSLGY